MSKKSILIVDDEVINLQVLQNILQDEYQVLFAKSADRAIELARSNLPDLILMDIMMPEKTGYEALEELQAEPSTSRIPLIFVTAMSDVEDESRGLELGAVDYITKPVNADIVKARVKNHLNLVRMEELNETRLQIIQSLGHAAEYKDNETGLHVIRMSHYSRLLGEKIGMESEQLDILFAASPMHDVGKIGIPDALLLKPGRLDPDEWEVMMTHTTIGRNIIGENNKSTLLRVAAEIAYNHHEKWDGSGYPQQLSGEDITIEGRIVALADVFDALTTVRPYKDAWTTDETLQYIEEQSGKSFDPELVSAFLSLEDDLLQIKTRWME